MGAEWRRLVTARAVMATAIRATIAAVGSPGTELEFAL